MKEPLGEAEARQLAKRIVLDGGSTVFSKHARAEMEDDDMTEVDVANVIRGGRPESGKFCDFKDGSWRYRFCTNKFGVVVAFRSEDELVVVTAWRLKK